MISKDQLKSIMPKLSANALEQNIGPLNDSMTEFNINTPARIAAFIAQLAHESGEFSATSENMNYSAARLMQVWPKRFPNIDIANKYAHNPETLGNLVYANRMGNGDEKSGDGYRYRGRGPIGLTGKKMYIDFGKAINADLVNHPEQVEKPLIGVKSAAWFWNMRGLNELADQGDFDQITFKINGGYIGQDSRNAYWATAKKVLTIT